MDATYHTDGLGTGAAEHPAADRAASAHPGPDYSTRHRATRGARNRGRSAWPRGKRHRLRGVTDARAAVYVHAVPVVWRRGHRARRSARAATNRPRRRAPRAQAALLYALRIE